MKNLKDQPISSSQQAPNSHSPIELSTNLPDWIRGQSNDLIREAVKRGVKQKWIPSHYQECSGVLKLFGLETTGQKTGVEAGFFFKDMQHWTTNTNESFTLLLFPMLKGSSFLIGMERQNSNNSDSKSRERFWVGVYRNHEEEWFCSCAKFETTSGKNGMSRTITKLETDKERVTVMLDCLSYLNLAFNLVQNGNKATLSNPGPDSFSWMRAFFLRHMSELFDQPPERLVEYFSKTDGGDKIYREYMEKRRAEYIASGVIDSLPGSLDPSKFLKLWKNLLENRLTSYYSGFKESERSKALLAQWIKLFTNKDLLDFFIASVYGKRNLSPEENKAIKSLLKSSKDQFMIFMDSEKALDFEFLIAASIFGPFFYNQLFCNKLNYSWPSKRFLNRLKEVSTKHPQLQEMYESLSKKIEKDGYDTIGLILEDLEDEKNSDILFDLFYPPSLQELKKTESKYLKARGEIRDLLNRCCWFERGDEEEVIQKILEKLPENIDDEKNNDEEELKENAIGLLNLLEKFTRVTENYPGLQGKGKGKENKAEIKLRRVLSRSLGDLLKRRKEKENKPAETSVSLNNEKSNTDEDPKKDPKVETLTNKKENSKKENTEIVGINTQKYSQNTHLNTKQVLYKLWDYSDDDEKDDEKEDLNETQNVDDQKEDLNGTQNVVKKKEEVEIVNPNLIQESDSSLNQEEKDNQNITSYLKKNNSTDNDQQSQETESQKVLSDQVDSIRQKSSSIENDTKQKKSVPPSLKSHYVSRRIPELSIPLNYGFLSEEDKFLKLLEGINNGYHVYLYGINTPHFMSLHEVMKEYIDEGYSLQDLQEDLMDYEDESIVIEGLRKKEDLAPFLKGSTRELAQNGFIRLLLDTIQFVQDGGSNSNTGMDQIQKDIRNIIELVKEAAELKQNSSTASTNIHSFYKSNPQQTGNKKTFNIYNAEEWDPQTNDSDSSNESHDSEEKEYILEETPK